MDDAIIYPSADELDTIGYTQDYTVRLYLVPAKEAESGRPEVVIHGGVGNIRKPKPSYQNRWCCIGEYNADVQGGDVLDALKGLEDKLMAVADAYRGEWSDADDGSLFPWEHPLPTCGRWEEDIGYRCQDLREAWDRAKLI